MRNTIILVVLIFFSCSISAFSQENTSKKKVKAIGSLQLGTLIGKNSNNISRTDFSIGASAGVRFANNIETSIATDVLIFDEFTNICPALKFTYSPIKNFPVKPYFETSIGHSFVSETTYENQYYIDFKKRGGIYSSTGLGIRIENKQANYIGISGGFLHSKAFAEWTYEWNNYTENIDQNFNRWYLNFSFGF